MTLSANEVDLTKSQFTWIGKKVTGEHSGSIALKSANIVLDESEKIKKAELVMDMSSLTVTDLTGEWADKFLNHMKSADFFEVSKYPTSKLDITEDNGKELKGNLTIKGKTAPVVISYTKKDKNYLGQLTFDRTKFDMNFRSGNFFKDLGDKMIYDDVNLKFDIKLK